MKPIRILVLLLCIFFVFDSLQAQIIWDGPTLSFTKEEFSDWTLEENQDRITDAVWITRANSGGIFNIATEMSYEKNSSPADTEWAFGTTAGLDTLTFNTFQETHGSNAPGVVDQDMVVHLISEDIYIDVKFTSWSRGGGGFSYERSTDQAASLEDFDSNTEIKIYPNPTRDYLHVIGLTIPDNYRIYNIEGNEAKSGKIDKNDKIEIKHLANGLYLLELENGHIFRFIKK